MTRIGEEHFAVQDYLGTSEREVILQVVGADGDRGECRFTEGGTGTERTQEEIFSARIEHREITFGKNDLLRVALRTRQSRDRQGKLKADHTVVRVLRHIDGGRQLPLDFDDA